jgi:signal transduction histidine kinase
MDADAPTAWKADEVGWLIATLMAVLAAGCLWAALRYRRMYRAAIGERGWLLERERASAAQAAVDAERTRIAAELHDIVSHNVSLMVVQANAAREVLTAQPDEATAAIAAIETAGRGAMTELRHLLGLLAPDGDGDTLAPQPSLARLDQLVDRIAFAGLPVDVRVAGEPRALPAGIDVTAYRIVQEALTNALKHGDGRGAQVMIRYAGQALRVEILSTGPATTAGGGDGRGLLGLRERVALYGGDFDARRRLGGGYRVRASLPLDSP